MPFQNKLVGLGVAHWERSAARETPRGADMIEFVRGAEQIGADSVWVTDHLLGEPYIDGPSYNTKFSEDWKGFKTGYWECWTLLSAFAAVTERVQIGSLVSNTGFRNPGLLARMADNVEELSGGRVVLGLGAGDYPSEHQFFGYPWERRISRFEEALKIICPLMRGEVVSHEGEFYTMHEAQLVPKGGRPEGPPILIGLLKGGPRMQRLVVQYADIWNCWLHQVDSRLPRYLEELQSITEACEKHGRDPSTLGKNVSVSVCLPGHTVYTEDSPVIDGSENEIADTLGQWLQADLDHINVWLEPSNMDGIEGFVRVLEQLR